MNIPIFFLKKLFSLLVLLFLSVTFPSQLSALQPEVPVLEGSVRMLNGFPASGTKIILWDGLRNYRTVTDEKGLYSVQGLSQGRIFAIRLSPKGFPSVRADGFRFPEQGNLSITMEYGALQQGGYHTSRIPSNPTTGYSWSLLVTGSESVVRYHENSMEKAQETTGRELAGRGGHELWTFEAVGRGISTIVLGYRRPWERGTPPLRYHVLVFNVR